MFLDLDYNIKSIRWKDEGKQWHFKIKIADIINTQIIISKYKDGYSNTFMYKVLFTNCKWCELSDEFSDTYVRYDFENLKDAQTWAEIEYRRALQNFIQKVLLDTDDYIEVFA